MGRDDGPMDRLIPELPDLPHPLGRHVNHDPRSRRFRFADRVEAVTAAIKSIEWTRAVSIFDQGDLGSCTGNAAAGWVGTDDAVRPGLLVVGDQPVGEALAVSIYSRATAIDPYSGQYPPDDTGSDGLSVAKVLQSLGLIDSYSHCFNLADVISAIQVSPVLVGINWYEGMFDPDSRGVVSISGGIAGGHEPLLVGYDLDGTLGFPAPFKFANSWGTGWGDAGYFYMTAATFSRLLFEDGDATVPHAATVPVPTPTPPPVPPTPDPVPPIPVPPAPDDRTWWERLWDWIIQTFFQT